MAWIFETGEMKAIPSGAIHLPDLDLDEAIVINDAKHKVKKSNGGFADMLLELRKGIFTVLRTTEVTHLRSKERIIT